MKTSAIVFVAALALTMASDSSEAKPKRSKRPPKRVTPTPTPAPEKEDSRLLRRGERVEFDARLIQGQLAKAGAVYLFQRVSKPLRSMVATPRSFTDKIVRPVYPRRRSGKREAR